MQPEDTDFITNIANSLALEVINKLKKANEYFREDAECIQKCIMIQHVAICHIILDYLLLLKDISPLKPEEIFAMIQEDTIKLIKEGKYE